MKRDTIAILAFTQTGFALARRLAEELGGEAARCGGEVRLREWTQEHFSRCGGLVYVGAAGIAVRAIAPHLVSKTTDPAVVVVDEAGRFAIPILSGHLGGANALACRIARSCGGVPVLTTATDVNGRFAVDLWAKRQNCAVLNPEQIKTVSAKILAGGTVRVCSDIPVSGEPPQGVAVAADPPWDVRVSWYNRNTGGLHLVPRVAVLGMGCRKGTSRQKLEEAFVHFWEKTGLCEKAICAVASIDLKKQEPGLVAFCAAHDWPFLTYPAGQLAKVPGNFTPSAFVSSVTGVDNVCERSAVLAAGGPVIIQKTVGEGVTFAVACKPFAPDWRWQE